MEDRSFGARLKELREEAGLTQPELAERAGMNRFGIAKIEQGVSEPSWDSVVKLCGALGVTCDAFMQSPASLPSPKRGRPPKAAAEPASPKRPRGRPKKE